LKTREPNNQKGDIMDAADEPPWQEIVESEKLRIIVQAVGTKRYGSESGKWVRGILRRLNDVGVFSIQDLLRSVVRLNSLLAETTHGAISPTTLDMLINEACDMIYGTVIPDQAVDATRAVGSS
jgi:hypothetical protein